MLCFLPGARQVWTGCDGGSEEEEEDHLQPGAAVRAGTSLRRDALPGHHTAGEAGGSHTPAREQNTGEFMENFVHRFVVLLSVRLGFGVRRTFLKVLLFASGVVPKQKSQKHQDWENPKDLQPSSWRCRSSRSSHWSRDLHLPRFNQPGRHIQT